MLTLSMNKARRFTGYARSIDPRCRLKGLPGPVKLFLYFSGPGFTPRPHLGNPQPRLLKSRDRPVLSLCRFLHYRPIRIIERRVAYDITGVKC